MNFSRLKAGLLVGILLSLSPTSAFGADIKLATMEPTLDTRSVEKSVAAPPVPQNRPEPPPKIITSLSPDAAEIADILELRPMIDQMAAFHRMGRADVQAEIAELRLHDQLLDSVLIAGLTVRDVAARIEREIAMLDRMHGALQSKRDKAVRYNSMATIFGTGVLNTIGQAGEMRVDEVPGEETELVGDGIALVLAAFALYQQGSHEHRTDVHPNMLAGVLERPTNKETQLPPIVWKYLNDVPPGVKDGRTRLQALHRHWRTFKLINSLSTSDGKNRAAHLSATSPKGVTDIALIEDQMALLADLRAEVYQIDRNLLELLLAFRAI